jgi:Ca2+-binding RTX toxin-like protein
MAIIRGTDGNDILIGSSLSDRISGLGGDDEIDPGLGGDDLIDGGSGVDTYLSFGGIVSLVDGSAREIGQSTATLVSIENVTGADTAIGDDGPNRFVSAFRVVGPGVEYSGNGGDDVLVGSAGADTLDGGDGADLVRGLDGIDLLIGGDGEDRLFGGAGDDVLQGGDGNDVLSPGDGGGSVDGGDGTDTLDLSLDDLGVPSGVTMSARLDTGVAQIGGGAPIALAGLENLTGGSADDLLVGDGGANRLRGGRGDDRLEGGGGDDVYVHRLAVDGAPADTGSDRILDTGGFDRLRFTLRQLDSAERVGDDLVLRGTSANLITITIEGQFAGNAVERLEDPASGGTIGLATGPVDGEDSSLLAGANAPDRLDGGGGDDLIFGQGGRDALQGGAGDDRIFGGGARDRLSGGDGNDRLAGEAGNDILAGDGGDDALFGGAGNDLLRGGAGADRFVMAPGTGNDRIADFGAGDVLDLRAFDAKTAQDAIAGARDDGRGLLFRFGQNTSVVLLGVTEIDPGQILT